MLRVEIARGIANIRKECITGISVKEKGGVGFEGYAEVVIDTMGGHSYHTVAMEIEDAERYANMLVLKVSC